MPLPPVFTDAEWLGQTPVDEARGRCGVVVQCPDGTKYRLALTPDCIKTMAEILYFYLANRGKCARQSARSSDSPRPAGSPQEGQ